MSTTRTYIQCIAAISRQAGHRIGKKCLNSSKFSLIKKKKKRMFLRTSMFFLGEYLEKIIPLVVKFCNVDDDELREYCIQAFESFVRR